MVFNKLNFNMLSTCQSSILILLQKMSVWSILLQNGTSAFPGCYWAFSRNFKDVLKMFKVCFLKKFKEFKEFQGILRIFKEFYGILRKFKEC